MPPSSRFTPTPDAWDIVLATDGSDADPLTLMLVQDGEAAMWEGVDAPSLATDQVVYREQAVMWQPQFGVGYSRRTQETSGTGQDGQILSGGTAYGRNATFPVPGIAMPAGKLTAVDLPDVVANTSGLRFFDSVEYGAYFWISTGGKYLMTFAGGTGVAGYFDLGGSFTTGQLQVFDNKLYIGGGGSGAIWEYDGASLTQAESSCKAVRMARVNWQPSNQVMDGSGGGTSADHLILTSPSSTGFYHVVSGNDPKVFANWIGSGGSPIPVTDSAYLIQSLVSGGSTIWFSANNGLHGFTETGRSVNLTPWVERAYHPSNGAGSLFYSDDERALVFYLHQHGLVAVTVNGTKQDTARFVQFGGRTPNETPIWGRPRAICPWVDGVFVAYFSPDENGVGSSYVMRLVLEKDGSYRWSGSECTIPNEEITFLRVTSPSGVPRLWIGTITGTGYAKLYYQSLPLSGNPWVDYKWGSSHTYATDWDVYLPRDDAGSSAPKVVRRYDVTGRGIENGNSVTVEASADDGEYVSQGVVTAGPRSSFVATTYQDGVWWDWRARVTNSETQPVVLESFQARMSVLPEQADVWTFRCQLAAGQGIGSGAEDVQDPYTVRQRLRAFQRRGPIQMRRSPLSRETLTVKVEQGARIQTVKVRKTGETVVVLTFTVSVLQAGAIYDAGDVYGVSEYGSE